MSRQSTSLLAAAALAALASAASAQITIDGIVSPGEYGASPVAIQNNKTHFGNNFNELDAAYATYNPGSALNLAVTGNLAQGNFFLLFLDTRSGGGIANPTGGGYNQFGSVGGAHVDDFGTDTDGGTGVSATPGGGSILNAGFNPEKALDINYYPPNNAYYINVIDLTVPNSPNDNRDIFLGSGTPGAGATTSNYTRFTAPSGGTQTVPAGSVTHAFNNSNTNGVNDWSDADVVGPYPQGDPTSATTGLEMAFNAAFLDHEPGKAVRLMAVITGTNGNSDDYLSNQFLGSLPSGWDNQGEANAGRPLFDSRWLNGGDLAITLFEPAFNAGADNKWSTPGNWAGNFAPNGLEHDAAFKGAGGSVDLDTNVTLGTLKFSGSAGYDISTTAGKTLTMNAGAGAARIDVLAYSNVIHPQVTFATDTRINTSLADITFDSVAISGKTITMAGIGTVNFKVQNNAPGSIIAVDSGTVNFANDAGANTQLYVNSTANLNSVQHLDKLGVNPGGHVNMASRAAQGPSAHTLYSNGVSVAYDNGTSSYIATLDLNDNDLVVNYGGGANPFTEVQRAVFSGFTTTPEPNRAGIISSTSQADNGKEILALFDNSLLGTPDWPPGSGQTVNPNAVIGKYTYFGDMNLDGQVTGDDYPAIDSNLGTTPNPGIAWISGDANLDGIVTGDDYAVIDSNLGNGTANPLGAAGLAVPEPGSLAVIVMSGAGLVMRRRRNR